MKHVFVTACTSAALWAALAATPEACAASGVAVAVDLDVAAGVSADDVPTDGEVDEADVSSGWGMGARLGWDQSLIGVLYVRPELGVHGYDFGGDDGPGIWQGTAGLRFGIDLLLRAGLFAHAGVAHLDDTFFTYDSGLELGLGFIPVVDLGLHFAYQVVDPGGDAEFDFVKFGVHAGLDF
jgi:hypothetical protein